MSPETLWDQLKRAILQISEEVLGFTTYKNKDWFDENNQEIQKLLAKKRSSTKPNWLSYDVLRGGLPSVSFAASSSASFESSKRSGRPISQRELNLGDYWGFYKALKAVYGPTHHVQSLLCSADGQVLFTEKASILSRWSEHFQSLFSADSIVQDPAVLRIPQQPFKP